MSEISAGTSVVDVPSRQAFEARTADRRVAGYAAYSRNGEGGTLNHTGVEDDVAGEAVGARRAGVRAAHSRTGDVVTLTRTVGEEEFRGQSVGDQLARVALEQFRVEGLQVDAQCSFIADFIEKNPEYQDLLV